VGRQPENRSQVADAADCCGSVEITIARIEKTRLRIRAIRRIEIEQSGEAAVGGDSEDRSVRHVSSRGRRGLPSGAVKNAVRTKDEFPRYDVVRDLVKRLERAARRYFVNDRILLDSQAEQ